MTGARGARIAWAAAGLLGVLVLVLQGWGPPAWAEAFPPSAVNRFLDALASGTLAALLFLAPWAFPAPRWPWTKGISWAAVPGPLVFGALVALGRPLGEFDVLVAVQAGSALVLSAVQAVGFWGSHPRGRPPTAPSGRRSRALAVLSERENEVLAHIARGATNQEIADALFISVTTVKSHLSRIFEKTGARNRTEAARILLSEEGGCDQ